MVETIKIDRRLRAQSLLEKVDFDNITFGKVYSDHMFVADYIQGEWQNFAIQPYDYLKFLPGTAALHYGQSVFEGLKAYRNKGNDVLVFRPDMNQKRLNISAERMCIPSVPEEIFMGGLTELLRIDRDWVPRGTDKSLYIRPFIFAVDEYIGLKPSENYKFIIFTCPVGAYYSRPVRVKIETHYSRTVEGGTGYAKAAGNYAGSLYPARLAQQKGYDQLIWTDGKTHQYIEEAGTMNIMFMIDDTLVTSETLDTVLKGITRESVLTLARDWGYQVEERQVSVEEIVAAVKSGRLKEAFGTGTAATITSISMIGFDGQDYVLPEITDDAFSKKALNELNAIKTGAKEDTYGWVYKV